MGFFQKIIDGLRKTKQQIGFKLNELFKRGIFDEDFYDDLECILLSSDIGEDTTVDIIDELRERMRKDRVSDAKKANEYLRQVMADILGDEEFEFSTPCVIMVAGVNGVGKTTTIGKLANNFVKQGKSVVIAAADTFRAAAGEQLEVWANRAKVRIIKEETFATVVLVTIHEGRNRQVRRMFESFGHRVLQLRRVQFGPLQLGDLQRGQWRTLTPIELNKLMACK